MKRAVTIALCCWALGSQAHAQAPAQPTVLPAADGGTVDLHDMSARVDTAVARLIEQARADARAALAKKNYAAALKSLESAHELDPTGVETTLQLADLQVLLGHAERAEALYRELIALAPDRGSAHAALADLLAKDASKPERLKEAGDLYARARELLGNDASLLLRQARLAATRGLSDEAERTYQSYLQSTRPDDALRLELGDFYRDEGKPDEAARWYREVSSGERARLAAQRIFELEVDREARRYGLSRPDTASDAQARALAAKARVQSAQGQKKPAEALLREALRSSPGLASVHADLADLLRETQRDDEAELEYLRALALDGTLPDVPLRLSQLYLAAQSPRAAEAALLAERALQLRPDWTEPQLLLARAYRAQGDLPRALSRVKRFLAQAPEGEEREQALALQTALEGLLGGATTASESATGGHGQKLPRDPLARARAFIARGRADAALVELQRLNARETNVEALALQAQLLRAAGRAREAATVLERALQAAPERADLHQAIAASLLDLGHEAAARPHLLDCERAHRAACTYWLARLDAGADHGLTSALHDSTRLFDLLRARDRLANLHADRDGQVSQGDIDALRTRTGQRITAVSVMALALLALLGITALAVYRRRWGGLDLGTFLDRHPDAGPDVQRVLSAIRHEVLKHNTLMLGGLIESVRGGAATREAAEHILRAFFGDDGRGGVAPRLHAYIEQLDNLARAQGERLNLTRRDPLVSALLEGLSRVRALQDTLLRADTLSPAARQQLAHALERADEALNRRGHAELRALLDRVRLLHVDAALLRQVFDRIRHEPALAGESIAELSVDVRSSLPCTLAMPRQAFDDILSNLFRNALQASLQHTRERPVIVGVAVELEADPITAIERVVLRVRDRVPSVPDREQLQHAYIEAGLGLTADLVARHAGSLDVASNEPGFAKAVVLRLPVDAGSES